MKKYYITTPIYYVNDEPHVGHAYTTLAADALARYHSLGEEKVFFSVGVDENSQKNVQAMKQAGENDLAAYLNRMSKLWKRGWDDLNIAYDRFIRTTSAEHRRAVERFWRAVKSSGDIYQGVYEGLYCLGCESFKTENERADEKCPLHPNAALQPIKEQNYFFKASAYREPLLKWLDSHPDFVQPESRRHEIRNYIQDHFEDFSISREAKNLETGIPVPGDAKQRIYVWFDALINYLTAVGYGADDREFKNWWPADLHLVGKDIIKFHCALWPAMIMSAAKSDPLLQDETGAPLLPQSIFAHGFFTVQGQKISKSLGNAVDPRDFIPKYGLDAVRYYLLREIPFGEDGDFSLERLEERYVHDLANTLGNLVNRALVMSRKYFNGAVPPSLSHKSEFTFADEHGVSTLTRRFNECVERIRFDLALEAVWNGVDKNYGLIQANKFIEDTQPFKLIKTDPDAVGAILYSLLEYCRVIAWLVQPVMPQTSLQIIEQLGQDIEIEQHKKLIELTVWGGLKPGTPLPEPKILFKKIA